MNPRKLLLDASRQVLAGALLAILSVLSIDATAHAADPCEVGFAAVDVTPELDGERPVWLAGLARNRAAKKIHDRLYARAIVLRHGGQRFALVSVDSIGLQHPLVERARSELPEFTYVLVASTHTHEGPDCIGLWGPDETTSGCDPQYLDQLIAAIVDSVRQADSAAEPATAEYGTAIDGTVLRDFRLPEVKDPVLRVVRFRRVADGEVAGLLVQWNSHGAEPGGEQITRDFMGVTVEALEEQHRAPVVYFTGAIGGLMGTPDDRFIDDEGRQQATSAMHFIELYGQAVAELVNRALDDMTPVESTPLDVASERVALRLDNRGYRQARAVNVLTRPAFEATDDPLQFGEALAPTELDGDQVLASEVACLRLGELHIAAIPGELYPELVYGHLPPADPAADFPGAPPEPAIAEWLPEERLLVFGLANDEVGYIVPQRQWDTEAPFAFGRERPQYGEVNSLGPHTARSIMESLARCADKLRRQSQGE